MLGRAAVIIALFAMLAAAAGYGAYVWISLGDVTMSGHGVTALVLGVVVSIALGAGLMALVFFSHRSGHDELIVQDLDAD